MSKRILLIEDEELIREMYQLAISQQGYEIDAVEDGQMAVDKLLKADPKYDLILLDVMLPGLDGISVLKQIKQPTSPAKDIPVFLLTNLNLDDLVKEAMELGALQYFVKSNILPQQIINEIDNFFKQHG